MTGYKITVWCERGDVKTALLAAWDAVKHYENPGAEDFVLEGSPSLVHGFGEAMGFSVVVEPADGEPSHE
jgi:hypothetical protein